MKSTKKKKKKKLMSIPCKWHILYKQKGAENEKGYIGNEVNKLQSIDD